jgi:hypothetical protein
VSHIHVASLSVKIEVYYDATYSHSSITVQSRMHHRRSVNHIEPVDGSDPSWTNPKKSYYLYVCIQCIFYINASSTVLYAHEISQNPNTWVLWSNRKRSETRALSTLRTEIRPAPEA